MDPRLNSLTPEKLLLSLADFIMPRLCLVCGRQLLVGERHLCTACMADLPLTQFEGMSHNPMADRLNSRLLPDMPGTGYCYAAALFHYQGYEDVTRSLKYHRNFAGGKYFARLLGARLAASELFADVDVVCCVPLHWSRKARRGYNQAEIIARQIWLELGPGVRFEPGLLRRVRRTGTQTRLSDSERAANVAGAFCVTRRPVSARHILIVDDVFTTGSTLAACFMELREAAGPSVRISAATLAFAG
ncbi:MAG: ComF family protein [Bacteroidales bacterium]|nr:ComF family protein [Bacteroidales bacterium]